MDTGLAILLIVVALGFGMLWGVTLTSVTKN